MKYNYQLFIEYDGTNSVGWQFQKNGPSIQENIERAIKKLIKKNINLIGSGRTDAGVHALEQSANFKSDYNIKDKVVFINSLNFFLFKNSISILDLKKKSKTFHSRYDAKKRSYTYIIINRNAPSVLNKKKAWHIRKRLDINEMKKGAQALKKIKDFSTFRASSCSAKSPIKTLERVRIVKKKNIIKICFVSKSFLQNQVRSMVGCLKYLAENKWNLKKFRQVINSKQRSNCAPPAPAHGLYLTKIKY